MTIDNLAIYLTRNFNDNPSSLTTFTTISTTSWTSDSGTTSAISSSSSVVSSTITAAASSATTIIAVAIELSSMQLPSPTTTSTATDASSSASPSKFSTGSKVTVGVAVPLAFAGIFSLYAAWKIRKHLKASGFWGPMPAGSIEVPRPDDSTSATTAAAAVAAKLRDLEGGSINEDEGKRWWRAMIPSWLSMGGGAPMASGGGYGIEMPAVGPTAEQSMINAPVPTPDPETCKAGKADHTTEHTTTPTHAERADSGPRTADSSLEGKTL